MKEQISKVIEESKEDYLDTDTANMQDLTELKEAIQLFVLNYVPLDTTMLKAKLLSDVIFEMITQPNEFIK